MPLSSCHGTEELAHMMRATILIVIAHNKYLCIKRIAFKLFRIFNILNVKLNKQIMTFFTKKILK